MDLYKIHSLDSGGLQLSDHSGVCLDDAEAHVMAEGTISAGGIAEVWQGARKVGTVMVPFLAEDRGADAANEW
jgi:hypothetical protein